MKNRWNLLFAAGMVLSIAGCSSESALDVYKKAADNAMAADSVTAGIDMTVKTEAQGVSIDMPMTLDMQMMNLQDSAKTSGFMNTSMTLYGTDITAAAYMSEGKLYTDAMGSRTITDLDLSSVENYVKPTSSDYFDSCTMEKNGTERTITCRVNPDKAAEVMNGTASAIRSEDSGLDLSGMTYTVSQRHGIHR